MLPAKKAPGESTDMDRAARVAKVKVNASLNRYDTLVHSGKRWSQPISVVPKGHSGVRPGAK